MREPMGRYPSYTRERVAQVTDRLREMVHSDRRALDVLEVAGPVDRIPHADVAGLEFRPAGLGEGFGPLWATHWFRLAVAVPAEWAGARVDLLWRTGTESTLWLDGRPVQGLVTGAYERPVAPLVDRAAGGETVRAEVELASNPYFGAQDVPRAPLPPARLTEAAVARFDAEAWDLWHDLRVLASLEAEDDLDPTWRGALLAGTNAFCNAWDAEDRATWSPAREAHLAPLLATRNADRVHELSAVGHAHLDTAWLWPLAETWRKAQRTFTTQLRLAREYPEHRFAVSSAQHLAWVRDRDPQLWAVVRAAIDAGTWVPVGGTWVEPDCNLPAGEALVRHFLLGQRFFEQELGGRATAFWNPDVFGYCNQLPQIVAGAGMTRFLTQKLSWNRFTTPPAHSFVWEGLDGTRVRTHFPPADTYNATADVDELRRGAREYKDHARSAHALLLFGHGDGGGGPTPEMLETLRRVGDLQGVPRTRIETPDAFFDRLEAADPDPPVVLGELYLEYHRGTYTTQAATKRLNRRAEAALHDAELWAAWAARLDRAPYPRAELTRLWELLLLNQFHDVLPGSSIGEVYVDAEAQLAEVVAGAEALSDAALRALAETTGDGPMVANATPWPRWHEVVELPDGSLAHADAFPSGCGITDGPQGAVRLAEDVEGFVLTGSITARVARDGTVTSLVLEGREALAGPSNVLELYDDRPTDFDAWDIDPFALETGKAGAGAHTARVVREDPLRVELEFEHAIGKRSRLVQRVRLDAGSDRLEFHTTVDWRERHTLLKVAFPLAVRSPVATYESAFGYTERPTHRSTDADAARFEVPGHRWADLSEHGFGVALLNDAKYGFSALGGTLRMSLLRAPTWPDPEADQGDDHVFAYALMPHLGGWREAGVVRAAREFHHPLRVLDHPAPPGGLASVDDEVLVLDAVKLAENSGALVLRLYEPHGGRGVARVRLDVPFTTARLANLLEDPGEPVTVEDETIILPYRPHQVLTVLVD